MCGKKAKWIDHLEHLVKEGKNVPTFQRITSLVSTGQIFTLQTLQLYHAYCIQANGSRKQECGVLKMEFQC